MVYWSNFVQYWSIKLRGFDLLQEKAIKLKRQLEPLVVKFYVYLRVSFMPSKEDN